MHHAQQDGLITERRRRKTIQNRLNQRARRERLRAEHPAPAKKPFHVDRWRLGDDPAPQRSAESETIASDEQSTPTEEPFPLNFIRNPPSSLTNPPPSLPADHLLHLVQYNLFRALYHNKHMLNSLAIAFVPGTPRLIPIESDEGFLTPLVLHPATPQTQIPSSLAPTPSQMCTRHATWINHLPFPVMRDKLIEHSDTFSHIDFCHDLIGPSFIGADWFRPRLSDQNPPESSMRLSGAAEEVDDEVTAKRQGLIVWGEPHVPGNWEATPGFLVKWAWAVEGSGELIRSSNAWRRRRGAEELRFAEVEG